jgi:transposase InsO family protein
VIAARNAACARTHHGNPVRWTRDDAATVLRNLTCRQEVIRQLGRDVDAVEIATIEWVDWFNHRRLLEPIGNVPPAELCARQSRFSRSDD